MRRHALWIARAMSRSDLTPLRADDVERLAGICKPEHPAAGTVLMAAGDAVDAVYVVQGGTVELAARRMTGRHVVGIVRPGGVVGDIPMFCERPMPFYAVAGADTAVLRLRRAELVELLQESSTLSLRWTTSVAKRLEETQHRLLCVLSKDLTAQVATLLLDECDPHTATAPVVALSHQTIAHMLGARRPSVSRVIDRLRRRGLVGSHYRRLVLLDVPALAAVAGEPLPAPGGCGPDTAWWEAAEG